MDDLPVQPGTYTLFIRLMDPQMIEIGRLGRFRIPAGIFAYQGSAQGTGGLRARLGRHLRGNGESTGMLIIYKQYRKYWGTFISLGR